MKKVFKRVHLLLINNILVTILGVIWASPMDVTVKSSIGKLFEPWMIATIPLLLHFSYMVSAAIKKYMSVQTCNIMLIVLDIYIFCSVIYLYLTKDLKTFIILTTVGSCFLAIFGGIFKIKMKDIISKVWSKDHENYLALDVMLNGLINILVISLTIVISKFVTEDNYDPLIFESLILGVISISYEIWYIKPLREIVKSFEEWKKIND